MRGRDRLLGQRPKPDARPEPRVASDRIDLAHGGPDGNCREPFARDAYLAPDNAAIRHA